METVREQARAVGVANALVTSDFGQVANGPIVAAYAAHLGALCQVGMSDDEVRTMIVENPRRLLADRASHPDD
jgi:predicted metal-dependent phosphotriesterase family hydrolase